MSMSRPQKPIAVLGAGSWGTALTLYLARREQDVRLFSVIAKEIEDIKRDGSNEAFMPGFRLPASVLPSANLEEALDGVGVILIAVPSHGYLSTLKAIEPYLKPGMSLLSATKGLDEKTLKLPNQMVEEVLGNDFPFAVLSGPTFAKEVALGLPSALDMASEDRTLLHQLHDRLNSDIFQIQPVRDVVGVEIGGIVKNIIAIAIGMAEGLGFGTNTKSALMTFGLQETKRLGVALHAKPETFYGLSGMGDLILTCSDNQSRNRRFGMYLGQGQSVQDAEKAVGQVVEGKRNAQLVMKLGESHQVSMPITNTMHAVMEGTIPPKIAFERLFTKSH